MTLEEYELYELTKPSFIQNVNFSTEAKHRDPIEPLVQGRRIGGIVGGGSTPEKTYLAIERGTASSSVRCGILIGTHLMFLGSVDKKPETYVVTYPDGIVRSYEGDVITDSIFNNSIKPLLTHAGYQVDSYSTGTLETTVPLNTVMPNWDNYKYVPIP